MREQQLEREQIQHALATSGGDGVSAAAALLDAAQQREKENEKEHAAAAAAGTHGRAITQRRLVWTAMAAGARSQKQQQQQGAEQEPAPSSSMLPAGRSKTAGVAPLASQGKFGGIVGLAFVDSEAVAAQLLQGPPSTADADAQWQLAVLLEHRVVLVDLSSSPEQRHLLPFDLQKQTPTAIAPLSVRYLAVGCSDGQIRVWDASWRWELAAAAYPAHAKEVRCLRALLPSGPAKHSPFLRFLSLGLEGAALLWNVPVCGGGGGGGGNVEIEPRGLRPIARLEGGYGQADEPVVHSILLDEMWTERLPFDQHTGSVPWPHHHAVGGPEFVHDEERDTLAVMDGNRIGGPALCVCGV